MNEDDINVETNDFTVKIEVDTPFGSGSITYEND